MLSRTRALNLLDFDLNISFRARKVTGTSEKRATGSAVGEKGQKGQKRPKRPRLMILVISWIMISTESKAIQWIPKC